MGREKMYQDTGWRDKKWKRKSVIGRNLGNQVTTCFVTKLSCQAQYLGDESHHVPLLLYGHKFLCKYLSHCSHPLPGNPVQQPEMRFETSVRCLRGQFHLNNFLRMIVELTCCWNHLRCHSFI